MAYYNKIDRKHVDFLLCDSASLKPVMGIELDDASHQRQDRIERDELVDKVFEQAGLPLRRAPARTAYTQQELEDLIRGQRLG
jgi:very-short-patch-repair endonuclease